MREKKKPNYKRRNKILYLIIVLSIFIAAWILGERIMYLALFVTITLPILSYIISLILIRRLIIKQSIPTLVVKENPARLTVNIINHTIVPFGQVDCTFFTDNFAIKLPDSETYDVLPSRSVREEVEFTILYRGQYKIGIKEIIATDITGLFTIKRKLKDAVDITVMPRIVEMSHLPLAVNIMTESNSRYDIKDEDYATISDIRQYLQGDSIKRVHWKLTAKRNEWLVKIFQSNALNKVNFIFDNKKLDIRYRESVMLEDRMIETAIGMGRFCLMKAMPVDFFTGSGDKASSRGVGEFMTVYDILGNLVYNENPRLSPWSILGQLLNEASGYINVIIFTARLDEILYERLMTATANGHYIAVIYFNTLFPDEESEKIYRLLNLGSVSCWRISDEGFGT